MLSQRLATAVLLRDVLVVRGDEAGLLRIASGEAMKARVKVEENGAYAFGVLSAPSQARAVSRLAVLS